jgi:hypothetical protein
MSRTSEKAELDATIIRALHGPVTHDSSAAAAMHRPRWSMTAMLLAVVATSTCSNDIVPVNASLSLTPDTHTTNITERQNANGRCLFDAGQYVDIPILMQLTSADGSPIGDASISVYADFAANTYSGISPLALYDDLNSNGVIDPDTELVSGVDDDIARVKTDRWTGSYALLLRINLSCSFRGEIFAFTGGVSSRAAIEVVADNIIQPEVNTQSET